MQYLHLRWLFSYRYTVLKVEQWSNNIVFTTSGTMMQFCLYRLFSYCVISRTTMQSYYKNGTVQYLIQLHLHWLFSYLWWKWNSDDIIALCRLLFHSVTSRTTNATTLQLYWRFSYCDRWKNDMQLHFCRFIFSAYLAKHCKLLN